MSDINPVALIPGVLATKYSTLASLICVLYDHKCSGLTFDSEVDFIWNRRWTSGKALFIFNRYFTTSVLIFDTIVFFNGSLTNKLAFVWWEVISSVTAVVSGGFILQARVYAVYDCDKRILAVMGTLCLIATVATLVLNFKDLPPGFAMSFSGLTGCYAMVPRLYFLGWIPALVFETILCVFMLVKAWRTYKEDWRSPLMNLIIRDSVLYFLTFVSVLLLNCLMWVMHPNVVAEVALGWELAVPCALGSRLLLNVRERYFQQESLLSLSLSGMSATATEMQPWKQR